MCKSRGCRGCGDGLVRRRRGARSRCWWSRIGNLEPRSVIPATTTSIGGSRSWCSPRSSTRTTRPSRCAGSISDGRRRRSSARPTKLKVLQVERYRSRRALSEGRAGRDVPVHRGAWQSRSRARHVLRHQSSGWGGHGERRRGRRAGRSCGTCRAPGCPAGAAGPAGPAGAAGRCWAGRSGWFGRRAQRVGGSPGAGRAAGSGRRSSGAPVRLDCRADRDQAGPAGPAGGLVGYEVVSAGQPDSATASRTTRLCRHLLHCSEGKLPLGGGFEPVTSGHDGATTWRLPDSDLVRPVEATDGASACATTQASSRSNVQFRVWAVCVVQP